jgi:hypothetical protein
MVASQYSSALMPALEDTMGSRMHESNHTHTIALLTVTKWRGAGTYTRLIEPGGPRYVDFFPALATENERYLRRCSFRPT